MNVSFPLSFLFPLLIIFWVFFFCFLLLIFLIFTIFTSTYSLSNVNAHAICFNAPGIFLAYSSQRYFAGIFQLATVWPGCSPTWFSSQFCNHHLPETMVSLLPFIGSCVWNIANCFFLVYPLVLTECFPKSFLGKGARETFLSLFMFDYLSYSQWVVTWVWNYIVGTNS